MKVTYRVIRSTYKCTNCDEEHKEITQSEGGRSRPSKCCPNFTMLLMESYSDEKPTWAEIKKIYGGPVPERPVYSTLLWHHNGLKK